ncbi:MAG: peptide-methionine (S)-S-oxide reductase MsrA [Thiotrichaceae bacterium]|nr:peptide-methionine (S)-S-oxide reductase MsrA [Thiotrichaceae bacterium]
MRLKSLFLFLLLFFSVSSSAETVKNIETATLAGGCFWCIESDFEKLDGVIEVISGYTDGHIENPTYKQVSAGNSGHIEAAIISYDSDKLSYSQILDFFWKHIDPTNDKGQFCDFGAQYRPAIFYQNDQQHQLAIESTKQVKKSKPFSAPLKVELIKASKFYPAEDYHQDYYKKNPYRYKFYRYSCGRDARVEKLWGKQ